MKNIEYLRTLNEEELAKKLQRELWLNEPITDHFEVWLGEDEEEGI